MPFHLHVLNLRDDATNRDLHQLFSGISIQLDGVTIIGGPKGEAFVTFDSESDLLRAMQMDGEENLSFRVATDIDRLRGINQMCMAKLQEKNSDPFFMPDDFSMDKKSHENVQSTNRQEGNYADPAKRTQSWEPPDGDTKRRRTNSDSDIDGCYDRDCLDGYKGHDHSYRPTQSAQPPWHLQRQVGLEPRLSPDATPAHSAIQIKETPYFSYKSRPLQYPFQPPVGPGHNDSIAGFQASANINPVTGLLPQNKSVLMPCKGPLLMSLLPKACKSRYCIQVSNLPPDVTASMVWSWFDGPKGKAIGVMLLKSPSDYVAFVIYGDPIHRDNGLRNSTMMVATFDVVETCRYISNFINDWSEWSDTKTQKSPIFETTHSGNDHYVEKWRLSQFTKTFAKQFDIPPSKPNRPPVPKNSTATTKTSSTKVKESKIAMKTPMETSSKHAQREASSKPAPMEASNKCADKMFLVIYQLSPTITATEILSWLSDGVSAMKLTFSEKDGPRESEAMAFVLFDSEERFAKAKLRIAQTDFITAQRPFDLAYRMINSYGDRCTVTETTLSGRDRFISPEERKQPPFQVKEKVEFNLVDIMDMQCLHLSGIPQEYAPAVVSSWYPTANGVVIMRRCACTGSEKETSEEFIEAIVAFKTRHDQSEAIDNDIALNLSRREKKKLFPDYYDHRYGQNCQTRLSGEQVIKILSRTDFEMKISTSSKTEPFRKVTLEEAKFIISKKASEVEMMSSTKGQSSLEEETSFIHHLKNKDDPLGSNFQFLLIYHMRKNLTACQVHALFPDALCALKVNFNDNYVGPYESTAIGYLCFKDFAGFKTAKKLLRNNTDDWMNLHVPTAISKSNRSQRFERSGVEYFLATISYKSTISEFSPSGADRLLTMEELAVVPVNPPFTLVNNPQCLHYIQLIGDVTGISAGEIWSQYRWHNHFAKGVVLLIRKTDPKRCIPFIAFDKLKACNSAIARATKHPCDTWPSVLKMTEQQTLGFLTESSDEYVIRVSTEAGPDRYLSPAEEKLLCFPTKESIKQESATMPTEKLKVAKSTKKKVDDLTGKLHDNKAATRERSTKKPNGKQSIDQKPGEQDDEKATVEKSDSQPDEKHSQPAQEQRHDKKNVKQGNSHYHHPIGDYDELTGVQCDSHPAEELHYGQRAEEQNYDKPIGKQHDSQETVQIIDKCVARKSTRPSKSIRHGFYIRLKRVPAEVTTACEILSLFTVPRSHGKSATLVKDCNGVGISAYVMFDEVEHRDSALAICQFSMRCTAYGRAVRLAELDPEYMIFESTECGEDRVLSAEERNALEEQFNQER